MNRVAITGIGIVCALGNNTAQFAEHLFAGDCGILPLTDPGVPPYKFTKGAEARAFRPLDHFSDKDLTMIERFAQLMAVAARESVAESGLRFDGELGDRTAIITGTGVGGKSSEQEGYQRLYQNGDPRVAPLTIPRTMTNAGASRVSLEFGIQGPTYTVATACSSSNHAIGQAFWMVRSGMVTAALAGGSEAVFVDGLLRAWEAMRVVSPDVCRPFSAGRRGLSLGEGAAMLVLEDWEHARARGANIRGEVLGFGMSSDAHHITQPNVDGLAKAMKWALRDGLREPGTGGAHQCARYGDTGERRSGSPCDSIGVRRSYGSSTRHVNKIHARPHARRSRCNRSSCHFTGAGTRHRAADRQLQHSGSGMQVERGNRTLPFCSVPTRGIQHICLRRIECVSGAGTTTLALLLGRGAENAAFDAR